MVGTRWESSNRPLFVRTVWKDGHHHVVLRGDEEASAQTARSVRRNPSSSRSGIKYTPPCTESSTFKVPSVKLLLASLRNIKSDTRPKRCKTEARDFVKSAITVDIIPSDSVRYNDLNKQVSFKNEKRSLRFVTTKSSSVDIHHFYGDSDSTISTPRPFSYDNYCVDQFNTTLSERVMIWLDLAIQNQKEFTNADFKKRVVTAQACPIVERTRTGKNVVHTKCDLKIEESNEDIKKLMMDSGVPPTPLVTSRVEFDQLRDSPSDSEDRRLSRTTTAKRQLHIFLPNLPKKSVDSGSLTSSKSSSALFQSNNNNKM